MPKLRRGLSRLDLVVLGVAGAVGTGVLFSSAGMTAVAGPGVVLGWLIGGIFYLFVGLTYAELSMAYPEAGGPSRYSVYTHGRAPNLINAFSDLIWYLFIPPIEALASVEGVNYFYPHLLTASGSPNTLGAILGVVFMLLFLPFNYYGIRAFARSTTSLGIVKLVLYLLVAIGFISLAHFHNFTGFGGFVPFGLSGVFAAIPLAMFAYGGIRVIPDYAEESNDKRSLGPSIIWTVIGQTIIYLLFAVAFLAALNWHTLALKVGQWASVSSIPGNPFLVIAGRANLGWLIVLTTVIAVLGPFVTGYIYQGAGSRVLFAMSRTGLVSARMREISHEYAVPLWALVVFTVVGAIVAYIAAPLPSIYALITDAVVAGYIGFAINPVAMLARRKQGGTPYLKGGTTIAWIAFAAASLVVYWSGWPSVPYAAILLTLAVIGFGFAYHVYDGMANALWYAVYVVFLTVMTYIGGVGAKSLFNSDVGSLIVVVVALAVFLPWGVASRLPQLGSPIQGASDSDEVAAAEGAE